MTGEIKKMRLEDYPPLLLEIPDGPKELYYRGTLPERDATLLTMVGSRGYSQYGKDVCEKLIEELAGYNISIVSGLALGLDSIAHKKALDVGLHTIAVPGSGLDESVLYPRSHRYLAKQIVSSGGALISEFEPKMKAALYTFPKRNRIMAGMSQAVLIIEASQRSGTLITARLAMEYNRDVLTVPGPIHSNKSYGPHHLIKNGAALIENGKDIVETLEIEPQKQECRKEYSLSRAEDLIYQALSSPVSKEDLMNSIGLPITDLNITLSVLELKGLVKIRLGKIHRA